MRGESHIRQHEILCILLGGRSHPIMSFEEIRLRHGVHVKTIKRDLMILESVPGYRVYSFNNQGNTYWKCDLVLTAAKPKLKQCAKCRQFKSTEDDFGSNRHLYDGLNRYCRPCAIEFRKSWVRRNYKRVLERNKLWKRRKAAERRRELLG